MFGLKSTGWCGLDPWLTIHSILTSFFLATAWRWRQKERHILRIYTAASRCYSVDMDRRRAAKLAWGIAWFFCCKTLPVEKSSKFKFDEYDSQSTENRNSATTANWFGRRRPALNPPKGIFSIRLRPSGPGEPHAASKALGRCWRWHVRRWKTAIGGVNPPLSPLAPLLSTPWLSRQVQAVI